VIARGVATILENLAEDAPIDPDAAAEAPTIVCLAGRNELDLAAAWLLQYLLRLRGHRVQVFSPDALASFTLDPLPLRHVAVVCLSLLSTNSAARARYLVRRVRRRARRARLLVGLWGHGAEAFSPAEVTAATAADKVVTTLAAAIADIEAALNEGQALPAAGVRRGPAPLAVSPGA
jgi:hypothetical protein